MKKLLLHLQEQYRLQPYYRLPLINPDIKFKVNQAFVYLGLMPIHVQRSNTLYCRLLAIWLFTLSSYMLLAQKATPAKVYELNLINNAGAETDGTEHETAN